MRKIFVVSVFYSCFFLMPTAILAAAWINSPEDTAPDWQTTAPYQRDIYLDFIVDPVSGSSGPIPGADYEGSADSSLWANDQVTMSGDMIWDVTETGVGIWNPEEWEYGDTMYGTLNIHLDNLDQAGSFKHIYFEYTVWSNFMSGYLVDPWIAWDIDLPAGSALSSTGFDVTNNGNGSWLIDMWAEVNPNSEWEELVMAVSVPSGSYYWLDDLHIATEVPIPSPVVILGSGLLVLAVIKRKFRKR